MEPIHRLFYYREFTNNGEFREEKFYAKLIKKDTDFWIRYDIIFFKKGDTSV